MKAISYLVVAACDCVCGHFSIESVKHFSTEDDAVAFREKLESECTDYDCHDRARFRILEVFATEATA